MTWYNDYLDVCHIHDTSAQCDSLANSFVLSGLLHINFISNFHNKLLDLIFITDSNDVVTLCNDQSFVICDDHNPEVIQKYSSLLKIRIVYFTSTALRLHLP